MSETIINDLADYRHKRVLGLAGMFGDQLVTSEFLVERTLYHLYGGDVIANLQTRCLCPNNWMSRPLC